MKTHYEGYQEARQNVAQMDRAGLIELLDDLYGRDNLPVGASDDQIRREAYRQLDQEWRTPYGQQNRLDAEALANSIRATHRQIRKNPLKQTISDN